MFYRSNCFENYENLALLWIFPYNQSYIILYKKLLFTYLYSWRSWIFYDLLNFFFLESVTNLYGVCQEL